MKCVAISGVKSLVMKDMEVPVFLSSNLDGGDEWNDSIMKKYYGF